MVLISEHPFRPLNSGLIRSYPPLNADLACEVLVLGTGITGARIFNRTELESYDVNLHGVTGTRVSGTTVDAKWIVFATGYGALETVKRRTVNLSSTFAFVISSSLTADRPYSNIRSGGLHPTARQSRQRF